MVLQSLCCLYVPDTYTPDIHYLYQNILLHYVMSSMISMHTCCCTCIIGVLSFVPNVKTSALYTFVPQLVLLRHSNVHSDILLHHHQNLYKVLLLFFNFAICPGPNFVFFLQNR